MKFNKLFHSVDVHTAGKALRIITSGVPFLQGKTMLEKQHYFSQHFDHIRKVLLEEPRGHKDLQGCIITSPISADAHFGVLLLDSEGTCSHIEGHDIISVVANGVELGLFHVEDSSEQQIIVDVPAGKITTTLHHKKNKINSVSYQHPPSYLVKDTIPIQLDDILHGIDLTISIAYSEGYYLIVKAHDLALKLDLNHLNFIKKISDSLLNRTESLITSTAQGENFSECRGVIIFNSQPQKKSLYQNITIKRNGQIDRSPCGSAIAALVAFLYNKQKISIDESIVFESITESQLEIKLLSTTTVRNQPAVITQITGKSYITGLQQFTVDPTDPLQDGFLLR